MLTVNYQPYVAIAPELVIKSYTYNKSMDTKSTLPINYIKTPTK